MEYYKVGGAVLAAIILVLGSLKMEVIKSIVDKITSGKGNVKVLSIVFLLIIATTPVILGLIIPTEPTKENAINPTIIQNNEQQDSNFEIAGQFAMQGIGLINEYSINRKSRKRIEDSIFVANRIERWVYQIGDFIGNKKTREDMYERIDKIENLSLFKVEKYYFFFINEIHSKVELEDSLNNIKAKIGSGIQVSIIDIMTYKKNKKESWKPTDPIKFGNGKRKVYLPCFTIER
ncbi:MAG: hypothetical protein V2A54_14180 [Bacteroidota bacterium]